MCYSKRNLPPLRPVIVMGNREDLFRICAEISQLRSQALMGEEACQDPVRHFRLAD